MNFPKIHTKKLCEPSAPLRECSIPSNHIPLRVTSIPPQKLPQRRRGLAEILVSAVPHHPHTPLFLKRIFPKIHTKKLCEPSAPLRECSIPSNHIPLRVTSIPPQKLPQRRRGLAEILVSAVPHHPHTPLFLKRIFPKIHTKKLCEPSAPLREDKYRLITHASHKILCKETYTISYQKDQKYY